MAYKIILDPGHGGSDPGANFNGRQEKDDNLRLVLAIGEPLETQYEASCSGPGDDGVWTYDGFTVYTYRENGVETIVDAE